MNYWSTVLNERLTRRRAIAATGGAALGAAILSACGGGDSAPVDKSGLLLARTDTSSKGVPGGIWPAGKTGAQAIDPVTAFNGQTYIEIMCLYSTLVKWGLNVEDRIPEPATTITGDAAESWEMSPDGMQVTYELRQNHKFDPRPPTNGRAMNAADVKWSWDRTLALSPFIAEVLNSKSEAGPIVSLNTPDDRTVVIKLAFPYGNINNELAHWYLFAMPIEAEDKFNIKSEARGSGPYFLQKWDVGDRYEFRKNPDWYVKGRPFLDGIDRIAIADPAAGLAQFENKSLWTPISSQLKQEDVLRIKDDHPAVDLFQMPKGGTPGGFFYTFSQRTDDLFRDVRMRRAASMLIDRDLYLETFFNVPQFRSAGLNVRSEWNTQLDTKCSNWIDPRDKSFGESGKYFNYDPAEAKKLMTAAGYKGEAIDWGSRSNQSDIDRTTVIGNMLEAGGMKLNRRILDLQTSWLREKASGGELYNGILNNVCRGTSDDTLLVDKYTPTGTDTTSKKPIPGITDQVLKMRTELDANKRNEMIKSLQKQLASEMTDIMFDTGTTFHVKWPWFKNYGSFSANGFNPTEGGSTSRAPTQYWYDASART